MTFFPQQGYQGYGSPDSIARKRRLAEQLMQGVARTPRNVGEGLSALGNALAVRGINSRADEAEAANNAAFMEKWGPLIGGYETSDGGSGPALTMSDLAQMAMDPNAPAGVQKALPIWAQALQGPKDNRTQQERLFEAVQKNPALGEWLTSQKRAGAASVTVSNNTGPTGINYGNPPKDMAWARTPDGKIKLDERGAPVPVPLQNTQAMRDVRAADAARLGASDKAQATIALIDSVLNDEQLGLATGWGSFNPIDMPGINARVRSKMEQLEGQAFLQAFESLKGGGQITQIEGEKATQAIARLKRAQTEDAYKEALAELRDIAARADERARSGAVSEGGPAPEGVDPETWKYMTPEQRALWQN